jgi:quercetin dioxygenase-like cupin family protein
MKLKSSPHISIPPMNLSSSKIIRQLLVAVVAVLFTSIGTFAAEPPPGFSRKVLHDQELSVSGRHGVIALIEVAPGGASGKHTHPGEEMGYVLEGKFLLEIEGQPPRLLKVGESFVIPGGVIHGAKNTGTVSAKVLSSYFVEKGQPLASPAK